MATYHNGVGGTVGEVAQAGTFGVDYSANDPALPAVGANFGASGPYANYALTALVPAASARMAIDVENVSGSQIAILLDDGTAAAGATPANATVFALAGGAGVGAQGGSWVSLVEKGRVSVFSSLTTAITFTGALTGATSATLAANWTGSSGLIFVTFSDGSVRQAAFTNGGTAVTWSGAVTATAAASAATAQVAVRVN